MSESGPFGAPLVVDGFVPTLMWGCESTDLHTRVSIFNYLSYHFPRENTLATLYIRFFDEDGDERGIYQEELPPFGQCHYELGSRFSEFRGTIGVQLVPKFAFKMPSVPIMTNYFIVYYDNEGHCDFSHEQNDMIFDVKGKYCEYLTPIRNSETLDISIIVRNAYFGDKPDQINSRWTLSLLDQRARRLQSCTMSLKARASRVIRLADVFPELKQYPTRELLAVSVAGRYFNQTPLTFVRHRSRDFNIHHF